MTIKAKMSQILCIFAIFLFASPCHTLSSPSDGDSNDQEHSRPFDVALYSELVKANPKQNIIESPLSIATTLAMAYIGVDGQTASEIKNTLAISAINTKDLALYYHDTLEKFQNSPIVNIANKIYFMKGYGVRRRFHDLIRKYFFAEIASVNFAKNYASARAINGWVENKTHNKIKDLVSPDQLNGDSRLVLVNAIHFKGEWASKFDAKLTRNFPFHLDDESTFVVEMMLQNGEFNFGFIRELNSEVLEMPYKDSNFSMLIILPQRGTRLSDVEKILNKFSLDDITKNMRKTELELSFPKFKSEYKIDLTKPLKNLGINRLFSMDAEFNKMLNATEGYQVTSFFHKAIIEVNEEGAEAAAATGAVLDNRFGEEPYTFVVNRPFYYTIKDEKNMKIFEGRINSKFTA